MTAGEVAPGLVVVLAGRIAVAEHTDLDLPQLVIRPGRATFWANWRNWRAVRR